MSYLPDAANHAGSVYSRNNPQILARLIRLVYTSQSYHSVCTWSNFQIKSWSKCSFRAKLRSCGACNGPVQYMFEDDWVSVRWAPSSPRPSNNVETKLLHARRHSPLPLPPAHVNPSGPIPKLVVCSGTAVRRAPMLIYHSKPHCRDLSDCVPLEIAYNVIYYSLLRVRPQQAGIFSLPHKDIW